MLANQPLHQPSHSETHDFHHMSGPKRILTSAALAMTSVFCLSAALVTMTSENKRADKPNANSPENPIHVNAVWQHLNNEPDRQIALALTLASVLAGFKAAEIYNKQLPTRYTASN